MPGGASAPATRIGQRARRVTNRRNAGAVWSDRIPRPYPLDGGVQRVRDPHRCRLCLTHLVRRPGAAGRIMKHLFRGLQAEKSLGKEKLRCYLPLEPVARRAVRDWLNMH